jgi:hypothetical protein
MTKRIFLSVFMVLMGTTAAQAQSLSERRAACDRNYRICLADTAPEQARCDQWHRSCHEEAEAAAVPQVLTRVTEEDCYDESYDLGYDTARLTYTPGIEFANRGIQRNEARLARIQAVCAARGLGESSQSGANDGARDFLETNPSLRPQTASQDRRVCRMLFAACSGARAAGSPGSLPLFGPSLPLAAPLTCRLIQVGCQEFFLEWTH